jgi:hypothetical protein
MLPCCGGCGRAPSDDRLVVGLVGLGFANGSTAFHAKRLLIWCFSLRAGAATGFERFQDRLEHGGVITGQGTPVPAAAAQDRGPRCGPGLGGRGRGRFFPPGWSYRLLLIDEVARPVVRLHRGRLEPRRDCTDDAARHLVHWYRQIGGPWLRKRIAPWAQRMEVEVAGLRVLPLGYRWGSCTAVGKLNIHWAAMQLTPDLWRAVERPLPDFAARRSRLRLAGPALWLPGRM